MKKERAKKLFIKDANMVQNNLRGFHTILNLSCAIRYGVSRAARDDACAECRRARAQSTAHALITKRPLIHGCALDRVLDKIVAVSYVCDRIVSELKYLAVPLGGKLSGVQAPR